MMLTDSAQIDSAAPPLGSSAAQSSDDTITVDGICWYTRRMGSGPPLLLLHGTGASTHSWRELAPALAQNHSVIMCDLPGHGLTSKARSQQMSLPGMSSCVSNLMKALSLEPQYIVGHSAGAALMCQMVLDGYCSPLKLVGINAALTPFNGIAGHVFAPIAQLLASNSILPKLVGWRARHGRFTQRLLQDTGSRISPEGVRYYENLLRNPRHVAGALSMMANWDLESFSKRLPTLTVPLLLLTGSNDRTVSPSQSNRVSQQVAAAQTQCLPDLGHLAHEEDAKTVEQSIQFWLHSAPAKSTAATKENTCNDPSY